MKKYFFSLVMMLHTSSIFAQVTAPEPEFINSYCILTSDATYDQLPKESGTIGKHENKAKKWGKLLGGAASIVGAAGSLGAIGAASSGSVSGVMTGVRVMGTASSVGTAADAVSGLAGSSGMDIIFKGGKSAYTVQRGQDVRLLIKGEKTILTLETIIVLFDSMLRRKNVAFNGWNLSLHLSAVTKPKKLVMSTLQVINMANSHIY